MDLTGEQVRAGRAMLDWGQEELARRADVSVKTIKRFEATHGFIDGRAIWSVRNAMELAGIEFIRAEDWRERGDGVVFSKDRTARLRRKIVEAMHIHLDVHLKIESEKDPDLFERPIDNIVKMVTEAMAEGLKGKLTSALRRDE